MVLVDTSVWVDHLRQKSDALSHLLMQSQVAMHPMIIGELACGYLHGRTQLIELWNDLPQVIEASHNEALLCLNKHSLAGKGIGFIDLHLLASTLLTSNTLLWTNDRRLNAVALGMGVRFSGH